jgi:formate dehydrogenase major subunit
MGLSRREFFKVGTGSAAAFLLGFDARPVMAQAKELKIARTTETRSTCPYCSVSCGVIIHTLGDKAKNVTAQVVHVEGDPDHPINRGTLCPKGASLYQEILNDRRLKKPQVRRPGSDHWEDIAPGKSAAENWDAAIDEIAHLIKKTRDETFIETDANGKTVNRCEGIGFNGGCTDTNEFNYLVVKTMRSLGVCYLENQARV